MLSELAKHYVLQQMQKSKNILSKRKFLDKKSEKQKNCFKINMNQ
jgi:hypothetical protein